ncbi:MAG: EF-hand domain-containing protein [Planctomycetota bacterium]|jgi:Ca2+-binding EF-hand superfamily protein
MRITLALILLAVPAAADKLDDLFRVWDANGDGTLDKAEVPDPAIFAKVDVDKDGKLTRQEVGKFFGIDVPPDKPEKKGAPAKKGKKKGKKATESKMRNPRTLKERVAEFFRRLDKNKDKQVTKVEFPTGQAIFAAWDRNKNDALSEKEATRYIKADLRRLRANPRPDNFFDLYDLNRDDKVTRTEYSGPRNFFRRYDHDKNGAVTLSEMNMGPDQGRMSGKTKKGDKKFMADGPTQAPKRTLLDRYDKDGNGRITLKELGNAESVLQRLDKNGDGVLSGSECK